MAQMTSRIHIRVTSPEVWSRFTEAIDPDLDLAPLASKDVTTFFHNDLAYLPGQLTQVVTALVNVIQSDGIILADTTNINVDPYAYIVYSLGCGVKEIEEDGNYCFATNCIDAEDELLKCLNYKSYFKFTPEELENLKKVGIEAVKKGRKTAYQRIGQVSEPERIRTKDSVGPEDPEAAFNYISIDTYPSSFYEGVYNGKALEADPNQEIAINFDGVDFQIMLKTGTKMKTVSKEFITALAGKNYRSTYYEPFDAMDHLDEELEGQLYNVEDDAEQLDAALVAHRVKLFAQVVKMIKEESILRKILACVPRKKNKTLHVKRVTQIASLFCMNSQAEMYVLCAQAQKGNVLVIEIRKVVTSDLSKTTEDVISKTNMFNKEPSNNDD